MLKKLFQIIRRKRIKPIQFGSLTNAEPLSRVFGLDRGMPIDRYFVEGFLRSHSECIKGNILEVGENLYSEKLGPKWGKQISILRYQSGEAEKGIVHGDLTDTSTLPEEYFDCFICTQTFNFIFEVQKAVQGARFLLRKGGVLLGSVAGISQISRYDNERWGDYWRFTEASISRLLRNVFHENVQVKSWGNLVGAMAFLQGLSVEDLPSKKMLEENDPDYQLVITIKAWK